MPEKSYADTLDAVVPTRGGIEEHILCARAPGSLGSSASAELDLANVFGQSLPQNAAILIQFVFGGFGLGNFATCDFLDRKDTMLRLGAGKRPLIWVRGDHCSGEHLNGTQAIAITGTTVQLILLDGRVTGGVYSDENADYCYLGGLIPANPGDSRPRQARDCFERMETALGQAGMDFSHVIRTWLYLDRLLEWYDEFNAVRTAFFEERKVFDRLTPASTGIGAGNFAGTALVTGLLAIRPRVPQVSIQSVASPLQCPATDYRSSFSRAVEIQTPGRRKLLVSGTASITPDGKTAHPGNAASQIELTLDVVEALLQSRGMGWANTTRMIAYFRDMSDAPLFGAISRRRGLPPLPYVFSHADICRRDLLFEIELDAVSRTI